MCARGTSSISSVWTAVSRGHFSSCDFGKKISTNFVLKFVENKLIPQKRGTKRYLEFFKGLGYATGCVRYVYQDYQFLCFTEHHNFEEYWQMFKKNENDLLLFCCSSFQTVITVYIEVHVDCSQYSNFCTITAVSTFGTNSCRKIQANTQRQNFCWKRALHRNTEYLFVAVVCLRVFVLLCVLVFIFCVRVCVCVDHVTLDVPHNSRNEQKIWKKLIPCNCNDHSPTAQSLVSWWNDCS